MMQNLLDVKGIGQKTALKLNEIGIYTAADLAFTLPSDYVDFESPVSLKNTRVGDFCLFKILPSLLTFNLKFLVLKL